jgi:RNA polymerase sigma-70 factor (ECF subfamily)
MHVLLRYLRRAGYVPDAGQPTDGQLLERFVAHREEAAFEELLQRHGPMVLGACRRALRNEQDAEDAFQATFLVLVRKAHSIKPRELVGHWLYGVACRTALRAKSLENKRRAKEKAMPRPRNSPDDGWQDVWPVLDQELAALPAKYRLPVVLCDLESKSRKEVAAILGCAEGTLSSRLSRARALLARRLSLRGITLSGAALAALLSAQGAAGAVPTTVLSSTLKAAMLLTPGRALTAVGASANVAALAEAVEKTILIGKTKLTALWCGVAVLAIASAAVLYETQAEPEESEVYALLRIAAETPTLLTPPLDFQE